MPKYRFAKQYLASFQADAVCVCVCVCVCERERLLEGKPPNCVYVNNWTSLLSTYLVILSELITFSHVPLSTHFSTLVLIFGLVRYCLHTYRDRHTHSHLNTHTHAHTDSLLASPLVAGRGTSKGTVDLEEVADLALPDTMITIAFAGSTCQVPYVCALHLCESVCKHMFMTVIVIQFSFYNQCACTAYTYKV